MTLYLSRLTLDPRHAQARSELDRPYEMHRTLARGFADLPEARVLFRAERDRPGEATVLVQSRTAPDWEAARESLPYVRAIDARPLTLSGVEAGARLRFRLLCRPTKRLPGRGAVDAAGRPKDGPRVVLKTPEELFGWLRRQGERGGFSVEEAEFERAYWLDSRAEVRGQAQGVDRKGTPGMARRRDECEPMLGAVRFDGVLTVADADALRETVAGGIGTQKAFGFGLLSLASRG